MKDLKKQLANPEKVYRPIPFWSWNEKLNTQETACQIEQMDDVGMGGYFMHARGGLQTEYMGEEWMDNIKCGIYEGEKRDMGAWGYDENGWPSGFGAGVVNGMGLEYQQKYLRYELCEAEKSCEHTICCLPFENKYIHMYYDVNPFYVDTLDKKVIAEFINAVYVAYKEKLGSDFKKMSGFFTDEPQVSRNGIPWSFVLPEEYKKRYGEDLITSLPALFFETQGHKAVRFKFWALVRDLFTASYNKQIFEWCEANGTKLTGHMVLEDTMESQIVSNSACMPNYEFMHIPGMDWLCRNLNSLLIPVQVASVAHQTGKKQVLSETFALCGWDVSFEELKRIYEYQMVRGINLLCQHLEGYSLRGIRKRDYPATLFYQQPWWSEYKKLNDMFSRIGMLLTEGSVDFKVLVIHPISSAWVYYNEGDNGRVGELDEKLYKTLETLEENQIQYDLGDERILERHGEVDGDMLNVGKMSYSVILVPNSVNFAKKTVELLEKYQAGGGIIIFENEVPTMIDGVASNKIKKIAEKAIIAGSTKALGDAVPYIVRPIRLTEANGNLSGLVSTVRHFDKEKMTMYYIVNSSETEKRDITVCFKGKSAGKLDYMTGEILPCTQSVKDGEITVSLTLDSMCSAVYLAFDEEKPELIGKEAAELKPICFPVDSEWKISESDPNSLTLDFCDCYFDGKLQGKNIPVNNIQEMACDLKRPVDIDLFFSFNAEHKPSTPVYLVLETPEKFEISLNGKNIENTDCGYYRDKSFRKIDISKAFEIGDNTLKLSINFTQSEEVYENIVKSLQFESEKNKLTYSTEIEAVYIIGDFGIQTKGEFTELDRRAVRYDGEFTIIEKPRVLKQGNFVHQGFPFFNGRMVLSNKITLTAEDCIGRSIELTDRCSTVTNIWVNGNLVGNIMWKPYTVDVSRYLKEGENEIEVEIIGNLRNLLGPHHVKTGESYEVCPWCFFENSPLWSQGKNEEWDNRYCFVRYGLYLK